MGCFGSKQTQQTEQVDVQFTNKFADKDTPYMINKYINTNANLFHKDDATNMLLTNLVFYN